MTRQYVCIDLKSFFASVECVERQLDPLTTNLVVADTERTEKTICLAVTPPLKAYGISGRARLFEVIQAVRDINIARRRNAPNRRFSGKSCDAVELQRDNRLELDFHIAPPRMSYYIDYSTRIYHIYLQYVAPEDIHVYSIDEVFMDITDYLPAAKLDAYAFTKRILQHILHETGITATAGIGTNLYLAKIAMDITAKKIPADKDGVRIAYLDEESYRRELWDHQPLTDFWRIGGGYARKLKSHRMMTMGDIARCSVRHEDLLYRLFGVNAELLIDHAWGYEPCTIADIKSYRPTAESLGAGQVLLSPYSAEDTKKVVREMVDNLVLDLIDKHLVTDHIVLTVGYDIDNLSDPVRAQYYQGEVTIDHYGRRVPKAAHGTARLPRHTSSATDITEAVLSLFDRIVDSALLIRRLNLVAGHILNEKAVADNAPPEQITLFEDAAALDEKQEQRNRERRRQEAILTIKKRYGKNAILKGTSYEDGATARERNRQIGGHKA